MDPPWCRRGWEASHCPLSRTLPASLLNDPLSRPALAVARRAHSSVPSHFPRSALDVLIFNTAQIRVSCTLRPGTAVSTSMVVTAGAIHDYAARDAGMALCPLASCAQRLADTELLQWQGEVMLSAGGNAAPVTGKSRGRGPGTWKSTWSTPRGRQGGRGLPEWGRCTRCFRQADSYANS